MTAGPTCKARKEIANYHTSVANKLTTKIGDIKRSLSDGGKKGIQDIKKVKKRAQSALDDKKNKLKNMYLGQSWRSKRPDVTLFVEVVFMIILAVIMYYAWPYITGTVKPAFNKEQFSKAAKLPESAFNINDLAKVNAEAQSLRDYAGFFKSDPYSPANSGVYDLMVNVAIMPMIIFFVQFVLPPFVIAYLIWFIVKFWPHVFAALYGWLVAMYKYFTKLIQGKVGCKWYIRMVTGWKCSSPNFYQYYVNWRRRYIDRPIYYEKLKYIKRYHAARNKYYIVPWRKYITIPRRRYKVKAEFAKKLYVDRAIEVFLKKLRAMYPQYYTMPRNEFYKWLLGNNRHAAGMYAKAIQAKAQIEGKTYRSLTKNGKQCTCPGTKTPYKMVKNTVNKQVKKAISDVDGLISATNKIYDTVTAVKTHTTPTCATTDKVINNRRVIAGTTISVIIISIIALYLFSSTYGTPSWLKNIISPTKKYIVRGMSLVSIGNSYWSLPLIYLAAFVAVLSAVLLT